MRKLVSQVLRSSSARRLMRANPGAVSLLMPVIRTVRNESNQTTVASEGVDTRTLRARYSYAAFLRHYFLAKRFGAERPQTVMEFGPGDTIGVGLCWLICGANTYYAADAHRYATVAESLAVFDRLVKLFEARTPLPGEFPDMRPHFEDFGFPVDELDLSERRLNDIRAAIERMDNPAPGRIEIAYFAPWSSSSPVPAKSVDLAYSQAVMEHVTDLPGTYDAMAKWVKPGGIISHNIDLRSHGTSFDWNGHWSYSDSQWKRANNRQTYRAINRAPCSAHTELMRQAGFEILEVIRDEDFSGIGKQHLATSWRQLNEDDLNCSVAHLVARRSR